MDMEMTIKQTAIFPGRYVQSEDALQRLGEELERLGKNALIIAGGTAMEIEKLKSKEREAVMMTEKDKLMAQKKKEAEDRKKGVPKAGPIADAAEFKASQLARIGGRRGMRNPVLQLSKSQYLLQQEQVRLEAEMAHFLGTLAGR